MTVKRKTINMRLSEELHKAIRIKVATEDLTITDYILGLVEEDLKRD